MPNPPRDHAPLLDLLIVDDEPEARELLAEFCTAQRFRVASAADGRAAIQALERTTPAFPVVISDLHLPHADGVAVLEAARQANPACYVIIVTGYATIDAAVRAVKAGAYDFLAKPFVLGQLELVLNRVRDRMALEAESQSDGAPRSPSERRRSERTPVHEQIRQLENRIATLETLVMKVGHRSTGRSSRTSDISTFAADTLKR